MWALQTTVLLISLFCLITALPVMEDEDTMAIRGVPDGNNIDSDNTIDLSRLGPKAFGYPSIESGQAVETWDESSLMNPEEMGKYAEGDILMVPLGRSGMRAESLRWSDGVIPYVIEGNFDPEGREKIMKAIDEYHRLTCLRFVPYNGQTDYIAIENSKNGCFSAVGRTGGRQVVNLQSPNCLFKLGTVIHELLHTAGFMHEHRRPDRDSYITIHHDNIKPEFLENFYKAEEAKVNDFGVSYDYGSVMHYSEYAFSKNKQKTIVAKNSDLQMGQRNGFSPKDITKVNRMYNCDKGNPKSS